MSSNSSTLILVGVGLAVVLGLLFLSGDGARPAEEPADVGQETTSDVSTITTLPVPALTVDIGESVELGERETVLLSATVRGAGAGAIQYRWP